MTSQIHNHADHPSNEDTECEPDVRYPVPPGLRRRDGVEYGCMEPACDDCYAPVEIEVEL